MKGIHYLIALATAALDLGTKWWIITRFDQEVPVEVIAGFFNIVPLRNSGVAFGIFRQLDSPFKPVILSAVALAAMGAVAYYGRGLAAGSRWMPVVLAVVLGGILGNFIDRVIHQSVVDFIDLHWRGYHWYTFNVADSAITLGVIALLVDAFRDGARSK